MQETLKQEERSQKKQSQETSSQEGSDRRKIGHWRHNQRRSDCKRSDHRRSNHRRRDHMCSLGRETLIKIIIKRGAVATNSESSKERQKLMSQGKQMGVALLAEVLPYLHHFSLIHLTHHLHEVI